MGKLHLKRTPAEQAEHDLRKARKAARRAAKHARRHRDDLSEQEQTGPSSSKRRKVQETFEEDEESYGYFGSHSTSHKPDYDYIYAQMEEERFREKMWGAFEDDERLDSMEAKFNNYAHIPRRWRGGGMDRMEDELDIDPQMMEDEDYAEWIRTNMWRKKHAAEFEEQERKKAERAAREARARSFREETRRMERQEEERSRRRRREKERKRWAEARAQYESKWKTLLTSSTSESIELKFQDIPWPVFAVDIGPSDRTNKGKGRAVDEVTVDDLTAEAIASFLLPDEDPLGPSDAETMQKERRDRLRETMLRFHPDKFEGRILRFVRERDKERVQEAVGRVTRAITELLAAKPK
ncbi:hypothetical protein NM688_g2663 [Phlebia brevispora]|uniref:Uncharacterized protein n=1 Tax=Phlebia brevispora TaxID=194682 RepID=A0ACC1T8C3_9APHY|nr:hypothetical protein NM688_g2663 [Phlebia brevispora]